MVAHTDGVRIGEREADLPPNRSVVFPDGMQLAAEILTRGLHSRQQSPYDVILQRFVKHQDCSLGLFCEVV
jgi:hypothetical protein